MNILKNKTYAEEDRAERGINGLRALAEDAINEKPDGSSLWAFHAERVGMSAIAGGRKELQERVENKMHVKRASEELEEGSK